MINQETINIVDNNFVFKTEYPYKKDTVRASLISGERVEVNELGESYINIDSNYNNQTIKITYDLVVETNIDQLQARVNKLERQVENLTTVAEAYKEALENRVSITTFQTWLKLVEKKTGITLVDNNLGYVVTELYKTKQ